MFIVYAPYKNKINRGVYGCRHDGFEEYLPVIICICKSIEEAEYEKNKAIFSIYECLIHKENTENCNINTCFIIGEGSYETHKYQRIIDGINIIEIKENFNYIYEKKFEDCKLK